MKNILRIVVAVLTVVLMTQVAMAEEIYSPGQPGEVLYPADLFHPITVALFSGAEAGKKASRGNQNLADVAIREFSKAKWLAGNYNVGIKKLGKDRVKLLFVKGFAYGVLGEIPVHPGGRTESNNGVQGKTSAATNTAFLGWSGGDGYLEHYLQVRWCRFVRQPEGVFKQRPMVVGFTGFRQPFSRAVQQSKPGPGSAS